jgi:hypothetical protein
LPVVYIFTAPFPPNVAADAVPLAGGEFVRSGKSTAGVANSVATQFMVSFPYAETERGADGVASTASLQRANGSSLSAARTAKRWPSM